MAPAYNTLHLATSDILSSRSDLRELGLATLPIPANYYEDLEARFGLDTAAARAAAGVRHSLRSRRRR